MPQWEGGATYDQIWQKKAVAEVNWNQLALKIHNFMAVTRFRGRGQRLTDRYNNNSDKMIITSSRVY